ncbi:MAG: hypothetical protein CBC48_04155 [bacterium TMED88]|nr:MAG: hypothetical protein CBC48_04155 [bacterium TMED88]
MTSQLDVSVLQVMMANQGTSLYGTCAGMTSKTSQKQSRLAMGQQIVDALSDTNAIQVLSSLDLRETMLRLSAAQPIRQTSAQLLDDGGATNGFLAKTQEDGWCVVRALALAILGSESYSGAICHYLIAKGMSPEATVFNPADDTQVPYLELLRDDVAHLVSADATDLEVMTAFWRVLADLGNNDIQFGHQEIALLSHSLGITTNVLNAFTDANHDDAVFLEYGGHLGLEPSASESKLAIWVANWNFGDDVPGHYDVFTVQKMLAVPPSPAAAGTRQRRFALHHNPHVTIRSGSNSPPGRSQSPALGNAGATAAADQLAARPLAPPRPPPQQLASGLQAGAGRIIPPPPANAPYPDLGVHSTAMSLNPGARTFVSRPQSLLGLHEVPEPGIPGTGFATPHSSWGNVANTPERFPLGGHSAGAEQTQLEAALLAAQQRAAGQAQLEAALFAAQQAAGEFSPNAGLGAGTGALPHTPQSAVEAGALQASVTDPQFWLSLRDEASNLTTQSAGPYSIGDLSHQSFQQLKGVAELGSCPKLAVGPVFEPQFISLIYKWLEALAERLQSCYPGKCHLFLQMFDFAVLSHQHLLVMQNSQRDLALQRFRSLVETFQGSDQALVKRWTVWMIEALPTHIRGKLFSQKSQWSSRLLEDPNSVGAAGTLNIAALVSPLAAPDGIILVSLLSIYSNVGEQRGQMQNFLLNVPPCTVSTFTLKFDGWVTHIQSLRRFKIQLPDAAKVWTAFMNFISKLRESHTVEHYVTGILLREADSPVLAGDELRVLALINEVSTRLVGLIDSGFLVSAPKAKVVPTAKPPTQGAPQLFAAHTGNGTKAAGKGSKAPAENKGKPPGKGGKPPPKGGKPAATAPPAGGLAKVPCCIKWVENNGTCSDGDTCRHREAHVLPITQAMRESCQRIIAIRAQAVAEGKGKGKGKGTPAHRRFTLNGSPGHGGGPRPAPDPDPLQESSPIDQRFADKVGGAIEMILNPADASTGESVPTPASPPVVIPADGLAAAQWARARHSPTHQCLLQNCTVCRVVLAPLGPTAPGDQQTPAAFIDDDSASAGEPDLVAPAAEIAAPVYDPDDVLRLFPRPPPSARALRRRKKRQAKAKPQPAPRDDGYQTPNEALFDLAADDSSPERERTRLVVSGNAANSGALQPISAVGFHPDIVHRMLTEPDLWTSDWSNAYFQSDAPAERDSSFSGLRRGFLLRARR